MAEQLTVKQAKERYKLSASYLNRLLNQKRLRGHKEQTSLGTEYWLIDEDSLKEYLAGDRKPGVRKPSVREES